MFSLDIVDTDKFLELPATSQSLYFHLGMRADDDGFISSPKKIAAMVNCSIDDLKLLITKNYLIPFESGVVIITEWKVNNWIRADRKHDTRFSKELSMLTTENDVYKLTTNCQPTVNQEVTNCHTEDRLSKVSIGNNILSKDNMSNSKEYDEIINSWNTLNLTKLIRINSGSTREKLLKARVKQYGVEKVVQAINNIKESDFLQGQNSSGWVITFDWLIKPNSFIKVLENTYSNKSHKIIDKGECIDGKHRGDNAPADDSLFTRTKF